jgi:hypothetical protein
MQSSSSGGEPRVLRCPHCGAPLDAPPFALSTRCGYCGTTIKLAGPSAPPPVYPPIPPNPPRRSSGQLPVVLGLVAVATIGGAGAAYTSLREASVAPAAPARTAPPLPKPALAAKPKLAKPVEVRYPLRSLLGIDPLVDIDGSRAHLLGIFPTITSEARVDLSYRLPLDHPWFSAVELHWKNEKDGKLVSVAFKPPLGDEKFKNQKEIADCLAKGLGKPLVREINHLAGEVSYFWGAHFPKAWANVYSGYLWLTFQNPKGVAPVTFLQVVRSLDACTP